MTRHYAQRSALRRWQGDEKRWTIGGDGGWDYLALDHSGSRLFISHANHVEVLDTASGKYIADSSPCAMET